MNIWKIKILAAITLEWWHQLWYDVEKLPYSQWDIKGGYFLNEQGYLLRWCLIHNNTRITYILKWWYFYPKLHSHSLLNFRNKHNPILIRIFSILFFLNYGDSSDIIGKVNNKHFQIFTKNYIFRFVLSCEIHYQERRRLNNHNNQVKRLNIYLFSPVGKSIFLSCVIFVIFSDAFFHEKKVTTKM